MKQRIFIGTYLPRWDVHQGWDRRPISVKIEDLAEFKRAIEYECFNPIGWMGLAIQFWKW